VADRQATVPCVYCRTPLAVDDVAAAIDETSVRLAFQSIQPQRREAARGLSGLLIRLYQASLQRVWLWASELIIVSWWPWPVVLVVAMVTDTTVALLGSDWVPAGLQTQLWLRLHTRACPACRCRTEKDGGCDNVRCSQCRTDWCFACGRVRGGLDDDDYLCRCLRGQYRRWVDTHQELLFDLAVWALITCSVVTVLFCTGQLYLVHDWSRLVVQSAITFVVEAGSRLGGLCVHAGRQLANCAWHTFAWCMSWWWVVPCVAFIVLAVGLLWYVRLLLPYCLPVRTGPEVRGPSRGLWR